MPHDELNEATPTSRCLPFFTTYSKTEHSIISGLAMRAEHKGNFLYAGKHCGAVGYQSPLFTYNYPIKQTFLETHHFYACILFFPVP
jgi:hypothetical protein